MEQSDGFKGRLDRPGALRLTEEQIAQLKLRVGDTADQHYPAAAKRDAVDGIVLVDLLLNVEGQVLEAQVVAESPPGFGFGLAALDAAKTFEFVNPFRSQVLLSWEFAFLP
jgi:TonB family protein